MQKPSYAPADALREAHKSLIVDILYHAIKDKRQCGASEDDFADEDHESFCGEMGFLSGHEEIAAFAKSLWFYRLASELEEVTAEEILAILLGDDCPG